MSVFVCVSLTIREVSHSFEKLSNRDTKSSHFKSKKINNFLQNPLFLYNCRLIEDCSKI